MARTLPKPDLPDPRDLYERALDALIEINSMCDVLASLAERGAAKERPELVQVDAHSFCVMSSILSRRSKDAMELLRPVGTVVYRSLPERSIHAEGV